MLKKALFHFLLQTFGLLLLIGIPCNLQASFIENSSVGMTVHSKVLEAIEHAQDISGLPMGEFSALRGEIARTWKILAEEGVLQVRGQDREVRPIFVALQTIVEHVFASELQAGILFVEGTIHTPIPATPLCTKGEISTNLVDPSMESDPARLFTVQARATMLRDYLSKGGILYVAYPKDGFFKRTEEQRKIYQQELENYPNHLFDCPLDCESIPIDLIGATYFFHDEAKIPYVFAIQMTQANALQEEGDFGLWFGPLDCTAIQERVSNISELFAYALPRYLNAETQ